MDKIAQKRSLLNKLREMTNVSGIAAEKLFNPEFEDVMNRLRNETDDPIRAIITGDTIGEANAPADGMSLKSLLSSAKSNLNRREYMRAVADLGRFHKKMYDVVQILSSFKFNLDKVHEKFLFQDLDDESKQHLHDLKTRFTKASTNNTYFIKEANILDFFANIGTERGRALGAWEKRYPKQVSKLKKDSISLLSQSERLLSIVISVLKELASARATRNPDKYINASNKIIKAYEAYDKNFQNYYTTNVKDFLEKQQLIAPPKVDVSNKPEELGAQEIVEESKPESESIAPPQVMETEEPFELKPKNNLSPEPSYVGSPAVSSGPTSKTQTPPTDRSPIYRGSLEPSPNDTEPAPPPAPTLSNLNVTPSNPIDAGDFKSDQLGEEMWGTKAHVQFYQALNKMSGESPIVLSSFIKKYATSIQHKDMALAVKLFNIAKSIKGQ